MFTVIILIIATDAPSYYTEMQNIWKKYMNTHPSIKAYFIKGKLDNQKDDIYVDEDNFTIYTNIEDSLIPGILIKTVRSIEYICKNYEFKYIYRTNLSSFLNLKLMNEYAENNNFDYGAVIGKYQGHLFASGCGFFISKEMCHYLVNNEKMLDYKTHDDVAIGKLLTQKTNIFQVPRLDIININNEFAKVKENQNIFHYRCKNEKNMNKTVDNLNSLYEYFYNTNLT